VELCGEAWSNVGAFIDLHTHSTYSDGVLRPSELVREARVGGLSAIALTDHDVLDGIAEARAAGGREGVEVIAGVEISARCRYGEVHVLGIEVNAIDGSPLGRALARQCRSRKERIPRLLEKLRERGMPIGINEVMEAAGEGSVGRPHVAEVMVRKGFVANVDQAFARFLREGGPAYVARETVGVEEAIALIREAGGFAAIAHPGLIRTNGFTELGTFVRELATVGLDGLECFTSAHDAGTTAACVGIARRASLIPTGGSDFHGDKKAGVQLGRMRDGGRFPYAILADVRKRLAETRLGGRGRPGR
jgi:predicted metal-dependent phosphoesterase TrpH